MVFSLMGYPKGAALMNMKRWRLLKVTVLVTFCLRCVAPKALSTLIRWDGEAGMRDDDSCNFLNVWVTNYHEKRVFESVCRTSVVASVRCKNNSDVCGC